MGGAATSNIFYLFRDKKVKYGYSITSGDRYFEVPDDYEFYGLGCKVDDGKRYIAVSGVRWFTTMRKDYPAPLVLTRTYDEKYYKKFDNNDIIFIERTKDIPYDYPGVMGVPITFLDKWNPDQFEIVDKRDNIGGSFDTVEGQDTYNRILIRRK